MFSLKIKKVIKVILLTIIIILSLSFAGVFAFCFFLIKSSHSLEISNLATPLKIENYSKIQPIVDATIKTKSPTESNKSVSQKEPFKKLELDETFSRLKQVDHLEIDLKYSSALNLCNILCEDSQFARQTKPLLSYYQNEGRRAFDDPEFRLKLKSLSLLSQLFTSSTYHLIKGLKDNRFDELSLPDKIGLTLKFETHILPEFYSFIYRTRSFVEKNKGLESIKKLRNQCEQRNHDELKAECLSVIP